AMTPTETSSNTREHPTFRHVASGLRAVLGLRTLGCDGPMATRDPFVALDAGTDVRAHARTLRRVWEAALAGARGPPRPRPVIEQSWTRMQAAGLDPDRLRPRPALDADALAQVRESSAIATVLPVLRRSLGSLAQDAEHVLVICDAAGRILWL